MSAVSAYPALGCNTLASLDFYMGSGDQTRSSCLYGKHFTDWSNFYFVLCLLLYILRQALSQLLRKALKLICSPGRPEISDYFEQLSNYVLASIILIAGHGVSHLAFVIVYLTYLAMRQKDLFSTAWEKPCIFTCFFLSSLFLCCLKYIYI